MVVAAPLYHYTANVLLKFIYYGVCLWQIGWLFAAGRKQALLLFVSLAHKTFFAFVHHERWQRNYICPLFFTARSAKTFLPWQTKLTIRQI